jgi:hypothetical protein
MLPQTLAPTMDALSTDLICICNYAVPNAADPSDGVLCCLGSLCSSGTGDFGSDVQGQCTTLFGT